VEGNCCNCKKTRAAWVNEKMDGKKPMPNYLLKKCVKRSAKTFQINRVKQVSVSTNKEGETVWNLWSI